jgi:hypothetical protein
LTFPASHTLERQGGNYPLSSKKPLGLIERKTHSKYTEMATLNTSTGRGERGWGRCGGFELDPQTEWPSIYKLPKEI